MITLDAVGLSFADFRLGPISLEIESGIVGVVGPNGAGKTTLLSILAGVYERHAGTVVLDGERDPSSGLRRRELAASVGLSDAWFGDLDLAAHFAFFERVCPQWDGAYARRFAERIGVPLRKPLKRLSAGTRVKAALVCAFARRPRVAIFDEPWNALDPIMRLELSRELRNLAAETMPPSTVFVSSHDLDLVADVADRLMFVHEGRCVFYGTRADALARTRLSPGVSNTQLYQEIIGA